MQYGEIVELGRHRLMCGDATCYEDVEALLNGEGVDLVLTDPPYGMKRQHKNGHMRSSSAKVVYLRRDIVLKPLDYPVMLNDDSPDAARNHYEIVKYLTDRLIFWGGQYFAHFLPINGGWIFWNKRTGANSFSDGELAWCSIGERVRMYTQLWNGVCMGGSYRLNHRYSKARIHPTQKPVELHMHILEDFSKPGDVILDCFGGSGTTLIACEVTGRTCLMMEISPDYCDIIVNRFNKLTEGMIDFAASN